MLLTIDENTDNTRLDVYLSDLYEGVSRSKIQNAIKSGKVLVNTQIKKPSYVLKEGDNVEFENLIEEKSLNIEPEDIPLEVVWEDENMAVVNKPSGMLTHPTPLETSGTLVNALLYKYGVDGLSDLNGEFRRGIVHRLDRNTSGLLMIAKNNKAHEYLANLIKNHDMTKKYHAVLKGDYPLDEDVINEPIGRHKTQPHKMTVTPDGKPSTTILKVLERFKEATYVELTLVTGRTHQIRVHASFRHYPVFNDTLYGAGQGKIKTQEQVLQSFYLKFAKPFSAEIIELEIPPDEELSKVLTYFRNRRV
ncbi:MAG: RNA pseudouridine synthase [Candidatus Melainabacteria bacterium]|nr:MAG: RNA pseudouridine synthase [Candidatus Melainabacteria bacterium]